MVEPIDFPAPSEMREAKDSVTDQEKPASTPSNEVYARVGDTILLAARDGVRRGMTPQDIIREISRDHNVHLNVGELRLLLASRRI